MGSQPTIRRCPDCASLCPWCGRQRGQIRESGCGTALADTAKACRKAKRLQGVVCRVCGSGPGMADLNRGTDPQPLPP